MGTENLTLSWEPREGRLVSSVVSETLTQAWFLSLRQVAETSLGVESYSSGVASYRRYCNVSLLANEGNSHQICFSNRGGQLRFSVVGA